MMIRNKSELSSLRFQMERRLTIHGHADGAPANTRAAAIAVPMRGGPIIETWDDMAARRVDLSRMTHRGKPGRPGRDRTVGTRADRMLRHVDGAPGTTHSDNPIQIGTLSRNFRDRLACGRAPHWDLPDPVPRTPVLGGCRRLVPETRSTRSRAARPIGTAGARVRPRPGR